MQEAQIIIIIINQTSVHASDLTSVVSNARRQQGYEEVSCLTVASRRPNRVIEFACFDSKLQWERSTCELKQPKRRECLPRAVSNTAFIFVTKDPQITQDKQIRNRKQTVWKKQCTLSETNY